MTLKFSSVLQVVQINVRKSFIKLSAAVHELSTVH